MIVYKVHVQSQDIRLEKWSIDSDTYGYLDLCRDVFDEFVGNTYAQKDVEVQMRAYIRGEHIITVESNKSLMDLFELNGDGANHIDLYVKIYLLVIVSPETEQGQRANESTTEISSSSEVEVQGRFVDGLFDVQIQFVRSKNHE